MIAATARWLDGVAGDAQLGWDLLELENIPDSDDRWRQWCGLLRERGNHIHRRQAIRCWRIDELDDWEGYLARLSKSHRKKIRRMLKRELSSEHIHAKKAEDEESFDYGWDTLVELHQRRWAARNIDGCFSCPKFTDFLHRAALRFFQSNRLNLTWLEDHGRPVAAQIDLVDDAGVFSYQAGIDPTVEDYSPGQVLQANLVHQAANDRVGRYDFLRGDEGYKSSLRAVASACSTVRVTPNKTLAKLRSGAWSTGQTVKALLKAGLGRDEETSA